MHSRLFFVLLFAPISLGASIPPPFPILRVPLSSVNLDILHQNLTDWPAKNTQIQIADMDLYFGVTNYSPFPVPRRWNLTVAESLHRIETQLLHMNSSTEIWFRGFDSGPVWLHFYQPITPEAQKVLITKLQAAVVLKQIRLWTLAFGPREILPAYIQTSKDLLALFVMTISLHPSGVDQYR